MSEIKVLYTGPNYSLGVNEEYFFILSNCCTAVFYWRVLGVRPEPFCSSCGSVSSVMPVQSTMYAVWKARSSSEDFKIWTDIWFTGMEVTFDE